MFSIASTSVSLFMRGSIGGMGDTGGANVGGVFGPVGSTFGMNGKL